MSDKKSHTDNLSRRRMMQQMAAGAAVMAAPPALAQSARADSTPADFTKLMKELSNWGRWGAEDQTGAVNLITPAKRRAAMRLAREGASYSMARNAETKEAVDNAMPIVRKTIRTAPRLGSGHGPLGHIPVSE